ncbi:phosphoribosylanthranilate isomerase [Microbulbifer sp. TYP-18]|uniref:phosphoribosylanthranilate isomerase n=1 Tax=Microbulbifer sp. TYP-18 TaxID=3230024 RepID=UPI0034C64F1B
MQVKICGITRPEDAIMAVTLGADALGMVFYPHSPRCVSIDRAAEIAAAVPPFVTLVGLFVDADAAQVREVLDRVPLNLLQFHGAESADYCQQFGRPYIKALRMKEDLDVAGTMARYPQARGLLLDAFRPGVPGGTGETFDWQRVPRDSGRQIILAGGLSPENVAQAIAIARPQAVDVSGGVEASPGCKDERKVAEFIRAARCRV